MQVTADQTTPCTMVLDIEIDEPQVSRAFDTSFREFSRHINVPGFRPGKAPRVLVEKFVDLSRVRQHTLEKIIRESYPNALVEKAVEQYREPEIEPTDLEDKKPYKYRAIIPLAPKVELGPYKGLKVERPVFKLTERDVEDRITRLRDEKARLERVSDRGIQNGDVVIVENEITIEGAEAPEPARRQLAYIGNNIPGYDQNVMGLNSGDEVTFDLTYPEDFDDESKRGKQATYHVKIISISAKKLPEVNDDFVQEVSDAQTVDEFRDLMRRRLDADALRISDEVTEQRIIEKILAGSTIHFPEVLVRDEVQDKLRRLSNDLQRNEMTYEQYLSRAGKNAETHQAEVTAQSTEQVRALLALREIATSEGLGANDAEIDVEFDRIAAEGSVESETLELYRVDQNRRLQIANALIQQKLHDFLFANNTLVDVEQAGSVDEDEDADAAALEAAPQIDADTAEVEEDTAAVEEPLEK